ncbi:MAG: glycosyltransferase [Planktomarina sp.]
MHIAAFGMQTKHDAMQKVRLADPLTNMAATKRASYDLYFGGLPDPKLTPKDVTPPDIAWFYRTHVGTGPNVMTFAERGGLLVLDLDDHPGFLINHTKSDFLTLRNVHAVMASTASLAAVIRQINPNVYVVKNAVSDVQQSQAITAKRHDGPLRVLYGALNRADDWTEQCAALAPYFQTHSADFTVTVIFDKKVANSLRSSIPVQFIPLVKYQSYLDQVRQADVMLMPLRDTPFNCTKSDLKLIECLANGTVPIISETMAKITTVPDTCYLVARTPMDWGTHLTALRSQPDLLHAIRQTGLAHVRAHRTMEQQADRRLNILSALQSTHSILQYQRLQRLLPRDEHSPYPKFT